MIVCLDAGHGPASPGATHNGLDEQSLNWAMVQKIVRLFGETNAIVQTRPDYFMTPSLQERARTSNAAHADLFVSMHFNAFTRPSACGPEVYFWKNSVKGRHAAALIGDMITSETGRSCRMRPEDFYVLRAVKCPAVLIE
jgi:N-acetylmuramoyl-L-alanine amidase